MRVARMLLASVRGPDLVARLGGDEFAILLRYTDEALAQTIVRRIEAAVAADHAPGEPPLVLAMGAAATRGELLEAAQARADAQMLEAKRLQRDDRQAASM